MVLRAQLTCFGFRCRGGWSIWSSGRAGPTSKSLSPFSTWNIAHRAHDSRSSAAMHTWLTPPSLAAFQTQHMGADWEHPGPPPSGGLWGEVGMVWRMRWCASVCAVHVVVLPSSQNRIYLQSAHLRARRRWPSCVGGGGGGAFAVRRTDTWKGTVLSLLVSLFRRLTVLL